MSWTSSVYILLCIFFFHLHFPTSVYEYFISLNKCLFCLVYPATLANLKLDYWGCQIYKEIYYICLKWNSLVNTNWHALISGCTVFRTSLVKGCAKQLLTYCWYNIFWKNICIPMKPGGNYNIIVVLFSNEEIFSCRKFIKPCLNIQDV